VDSSMSIRPSLLGVGAIGLVGGSPMLVSGVDAVAWVGGGMMASRRKGVVVCTGRKVTGSGL
jgi:hypothetical protein